MVVEAGLVAEAGWVKRSCCLGFRFPVKGTEKIYIYIYVYGTYVRRYKGFFPPAWLAHRGFRVLRFGTVS